MQPSDPVPESTPDLEAIAQDPVFQTQMERLHRLTVWGRWWVVIVLWLTVGIASLWALRGEFALMMNYFTWAALRYGLADHPWATLGLALCVGMMASVLVWQSRNILWGLSKGDRQRLIHQVYQVRKQGRSHPLWRWIDPENPAR